MFTLRQINTFALKYEVTQNILFEHHLQNIRKSQNDCYKFNVNVF